MQRSPAQFDSRPRAGFTMLELLIVMGIIALLVTILVVAVGPALDAARVAATRATIVRIDDLIKKRVDEVNNFDLKDDARLLVDKLIPLGWSASNPNDLKAAEFIIRQTLLKQALPQRPEDMYGFDGEKDVVLVDDAPYVTSWSGEPTSPDIGTVPRHQHPHPELSSEVLYFALTKGNSLRAFADGTVHKVSVLEPDGLNQDHIRIDPDDGQGLFVDAWGNPLQFYNAPTRLIRTDPTSVAANLPAAEYQAAQALIAGLPSPVNFNNPAPPPLHPLKLDPLDLIGNLHTRFVADLTAPTIDLKKLDEKLYSYPQNGFVLAAPLIVSAGADGELGMDWPTWSHSGTGAGDTAFQRLGFPDADLTTPALEIDLAVLGDNITNRQQ